MADNGLSGCSGVVGADSPKWGYFGGYLGAARVLWLACGIDTEVTITSVVSVNVSGVLAEEKLRTIGTACDEFARKTGAKFVRRKGED